MIFPDMTLLCSRWALNSALNVLWGKKATLGGKSDPTDHPGPDSLIVIFINISYKPRILPALAWLRQQNQVGASR